MKAINIVSLIKILADLCTAKQNKDKIQFEWNLSKVLVNCISKG